MEHVNKFIKFEFKKREAIMERFLHRLLILILISMAYPAHAAILYVAGEDSELTYSATLDQTAGHFRAGYARGDFQILQSNAAVVQTGPVVSLSTGWFHASVYVNSA